MMRRGMPYIHIANAVAGSTTRYGSCSDQSSSLGQRCFCVAEGPLHIGRPVDGLVVTIDVAADWMFAVSNKAENLLDGSVTFAPRDAHPVFPPILEIDHGDAIQASLDEGEGVIAATGGVADIDADPV